MGAGVVLGSISAEARFGRIGGAIIRHTGRSGCDRRRNDCYRLGLDDDLRRRRWNIGRGAGAGFFTGFVGRSATPEDGKRSEETQHGDRGYFVFHPSNLSIRIDEAASHRPNRLSK